VYRRLPCGDTSADLRVCVVPIFLGHQIKSCKSIDHEIAMDRHTGDTNSLDETIVFNVCNDGRTAPPERLSSTGLRSRFLLPAGESRTGSVTPRPDANQHHHSSCTCSAVSRHDTPEWPDTTPWATIWYECLAMLVLFRLGTVSATGTDGFWSK
jgi:hypothetical protein